jgi:hypothetical protein
MPQLLDKSGREVLPGAALVDHHGDTVYLREAERPRHEASSGRVYVVEDPADVTSIAGAFNCASYFPHVFDLRWSDRAG